MALRTNRSIPVGTRAGVAQAALCLVFAWSPAATAQEKSPCTEDAMLVFDASQSMAAADADNAGLRRIDSVRTALARILPRVAPRRRLGLISYGPGSQQACNNIRLELRPKLDAARRIQSRVNALTPAGRTPLTRAVRMAAESLGHREGPATIVLLTDGEESCKGAPCELAMALKVESAALTVHVISYRIKGSIGSDGVFRARCLADQTGGLYVATDTVGELAAALEKVLACPFISDLRPVTIRSAASGP